VRIPYPQRCPRSSPEALETQSTTPQRGSRGPDAGSTHRVYPYDHREYPPLGSEGTAGLGETLIRRGLNRPKSIVAPFTYGHRVHPGWRYQDLW